MKELSIILLFIIYEQMSIIVGQFPQPRIYGGYFASKGQFPYQISLQQNGTHICGGAILTKSYVLTAAHCVTGENAELESPIDFVVLAGSTDIKKGGIPFAPKKFIVHEEYTYFKDDIALIQLKNHFHWNENIQPISIYERELQPNDVVTITGWGYTDNAEIVSDELKYHYFGVTSKRYCQKVIPGRYFERILCLNHAIHNGVCNGDSGGPAIFMGKLVGIANFIINGCGSKSPNVYANVYQFENWINKKMY